MEIADSLHKADKILITQRPQDGLLGGLWEFPGGKVNPDEKPAEACKREILEETGLCVDVGEAFAHVKHAYTHFKINMDVFYCRYRSGTVRLDGPVAHRWITINELNHFPFPKANHIV